MRLSLVFFERQQSYNTTRTPYSGGKKFPEREFTKDKPLAPVIDNQLFVKVAPFYAPKRYPISN